MNQKLITVRVKRKIGSPAGRVRDPIEFRIWTHARPSMWIGTDDAGGYCRLTASDLRKLRDALDVALGDA